MQTLEDSVEKAVQERKARTQWRVMWTKGGQAGRYVLPRPNGISAGAGSADSEAARTAPQGHGAFVPVGEVPVAVAADGDIAADKAGLKQSPHAVFCGRCHGDVKGRLVSPGCGWSCGKSAAGGGGLVASHLGAAS